MERIWSSPGSQECQLHIQACTSIFRSLLPSLLCLRPLHPLADNSISFWPQKAPTPLSSARHPPRWHRRDNDKLNYPPHCKNLKLQRSWTVLFATGSLLLGPCHHPLPVDGYQDCNPEGCR